MTTERRIEYLPVDDLVPDERNPKRHDLDTLGDSFRRFGYVEPITLDERTGQIVSGHGRVERLQLDREAGTDPPEGVTVADDGRWLVPVTRGWASANDEEAAAFLIAANRLVERGSWDGDLLTALITELADTNLDGVGWTEDELDDFIASLAESDVLWDPVVSESNTSEASGAPTVDERGDEYRAKGLRSMVLDYRLDTYDELIASAARIRRHRQIDTNADLVLALVREAVKDVPEDEPSADG